MALHPCRECQAQVSTEAPTCPHCGIADPISAAATQQAKNAESEPGCFNVLGFLIILSVTVGIFSMLAPDDPDHSIYDAHVMCEDFVEARLRTASTAKFPSIRSDEVVQDLGDGKYRVRAQVDAQNALGAQVRSTYDCTVQWTSGSSWRLESLSVSRR
jgi:hypothetical protein